MNQSEYLRLLEIELLKRNIQSTQEILQDYKEHFTHALKKGKTEIEISAKLGDPKTVAKAFETETLIEEVKNVDGGFNFKKAFTILGRLIILAPINFIILFIPGIIIFSLTITGWALAASAIAASLGSIAFITGTSLLSINPWFTFGIISLVTSFIGIGIIGFFIMYYITKFIIMGSISYLQWNAKFILEKN